MNDKILDEIYSTRERISEECGYDFKKLGERYKRLQEKCPRELLVTTKVPRSEPESLPLAGGEAGPDDDEFEDELVREVRAARYKIMEQCGYDMNTFFERLRRLQAEHPEKMVTEVPRTGLHPAAKAER